MQVSGCNDGYNQTYLEQQRGHLPISEHARQERVSGAWLP